MAEIVVGHVCTKPYLHQYLLRKLDPRSRPARTHPPLLMERLRALLNVRVHALDVLKPGRCYRKIRLSVVLNPGLMLDPHTHARVCAELNKHFNAELSAGVRYWRRKNTSKKDARKRALRTWGITEEEMHGDAIGPLFWPDDINPLQNRHALVGVVFPKPHIAKFLYGKLNPQSAITNPFGVDISQNILDLLDLPLHHTLGPKGDRSGPIPIALSPYAYGNIPEEKHAAICKYLERMFDLEFRRTVDFLRYKTGVSKVNAMQHVCDTYFITEDDISQDALIRTYNRMEKRLGRELHVGRPTPRPLTVYR